MEAYDTAFISARRAAATIAELDAACQAYRLSPGYEEGDSLDIWDAPDGWDEIALPSGEDLLVRTPAGEWGVWLNRERAWSAVDISDVLAPIYESITRAVQAGFGTDAEDDYALLGEILSV